MTGRPRCVAVIDDDADQRRLLRHTLELRGYQVVEFASVEQALGWEDELLPGRPSPLAESGLILLDIQLPGLSGVDAIRLFKETPGLQSIPIAMLTSVRDSETVLDCIRQGASDYFVKPLALVEIMKRVDALLADPTGILHKAAHAAVTWPLDEYILNEMKRSERNRSSFALIVGGVRKTERAEPLEGERAERAWRGKSEWSGGNPTPLDGFLKVVRNQFREFDVLVPVSPEDFIGLLISSDEKGLGANMRRIHRLFREYSGWPPLERKERWVLLLGGACYPEDARDRASLLAAAESKVSESAPADSHAPQAGSDFIVRTARCPACGKHFTYPKLVDRRFTPTSRDTDLRWAFEGLNPFWYATMVCSTCGLAGLESDWGELGRLAPPRFGWKFAPRRIGDPFNHPLQALIPHGLEEVLSPPYEAWMEPGGTTASLASDPLEGLPGREEFVRLAKLGDDPRLRIETVLARYCLVRETYRVAGASPLRRAKVAHRLAWLFREAEDKEREVDALREALDWYRTAFHFEDLTGAKPSDLEIYYLIGEISLRLGKESDAITIFDRLLKDPRTEAEEGFRRMVRRRWIEARND